LPHFFERPGHLDAAALAAASGVNLRLDYPGFAAELLCGALTASSTLKQAIRLAVSQHRIAVEFPWLGIRGFSSSKEALIN
jgi:hypothetical protein